MKFIEPMHHPGNQYMCPKERPGVHRAVAVQKAIWVTENDSKLIWESDAEKEQW